MPSKKTDRLPLVVIAPDKFKGSLSAAQVASAIARGLRRANPGIRIIEMPVADGGDGTLDAFLARGYKPHNITVTGPDNDPQPSMIALRHGTAIIETALTSGLAMRKSLSSSSLTTTSKGVGDAILAALDREAKTIIIGLGGSACTDGGAGMLQSLGVSLRDSAGVELKPGGAALLDLHAVDLSGIDARINGTEIILATDVLNPLHGRNGAAAVYGPQKGASSDDVATLDQALIHFAAHISANAARLPGAGAAGGIGFAALAILHASARPGIDLMLSLLEFEEHLDGVDLVITGEGRLDEQSFQGKAPIGVLTAAARHNIPTIAVCGTADLSSQPRHPDFESIWSLIDLAPDINTAIRDAGTLLEELAERIIVPRSLSA